MLEENDLHLYGIAQKSAIIKFPIRSSFLILEMAIHLLLLLFLSSNCVILAVLKCSEVIRFRISHKDCRLHSFFLRQHAREINVDKSWSIDDLFNEESNSLQSYSVSDPVKSVRSKSSPPQVKSRTKRNVKKSFLSPTIEYFATCISGMEKVLANEVKTLTGVDEASIRIGKSGVHYKGNQVTNLNNATFAPQRIMQVIYSLVDWNG